MDISQEVLVWFLNKMSPVWCRFNTQHRQQNHFYARFFKLNPALLARAPCEGSCRELISIFGPIIYYKTAYSPSLAKHFWYVQIHFPKWVLLLKWKARRCLCKRGKVFATVSSHGSKSLCNSKLRINWQPCFTSGEMCVCVRLTRFPALPFLWPASC